MNPPSSCPQLGNRTPSPGYTALGLHSSAEEAAPLKVMQLMPIFETPSTQESDFSYFLSGIIPNRDRGRFLRAAVLLFLILGGLVSLFVTWTVVMEFHARHSWPVAPGEVVSCEEKQRSGFSRQRTRYWMECEVRFAVPVDQCLTGTIAANERDPYPCYGTVSARSTTTWGVTNGWNNPEFRLSPKRILHDPNGPEVKFADESAWLAYPWPNILMMSVWMIACSVFLAMIQWRMRVLARGNLQTANGPDSPVDTNSI